MMKLWSDPLAPAVRKSIPTKCCSLEHIARARKTCEQLDMPFYLHDCSDRFKESVVDPFLAAYEKGDTPNPCVACNRFLKFGELLKLMKDLQCEKIATGHYARVAETENHIVLKQAVDEEKDQSYYLSLLTQEQLRSVLFPLGNLQKQEVFTLAKRFGVQLGEHYRESQDLCFFPEDKPEAFLKRYLPPSKEGPIEDEHGTVLGTHQGLPYSTIGQRRLGFGGQRIPLYVQRKDAPRNALIVATDGRDKSSFVIIDPPQWVSGSAPTTSEFEVRVHSLGHRHAGVLAQEEASWIFRFQRPVRGASPGQVLVLYNGDEVLGGARITGHTPATSTVA